MTIMEAIDARHSVRKYRDMPIPAELREQLDACALQCNEASGLDIVIRYDDPEGFDSRLAHYGSFSNVRNYIILKGRKTADFDYLCGYYGEKLVIFAQQCGLNTCWAALTFNKKKVRELVPADEKFSMVIALGYGETQGHDHKGKTIHDVVDVKGGMPVWFADGVKAALKAPTAVNQQKFCFSLSGEEASVRVKGIGSYAKVDLGIVAYHFEEASGRNVSH